MSKTIYPRAAIVPHTRVPIAFSSKVLLWTFTIYTSSRCAGLTYSKGYKSKDSAARKAEKVMNQLGFNKKG